MAGKNYRRVNVALVFPFLPVITTVVTQARTPAGDSVCVPTIMVKFLLKYVNSRKTVAVQIWNGVKYAK